MQVSPNCLVDPAAREVCVLPVTQAVAGGISCVYGNAVVMRKAGVPGLHADLKLALLQVCGG